jgi:calcium-translocating P-type ATPase
VNGAGFPRPVGLTSAEAAARRAAEGPNVVPVAAPPSLVRRLLAQLTHFFAVMLWVAAALALVAGLPALAVAIAVVVVVNAVFAEVQEQRAERATRQLRALVPATVRVRRDGHLVEIDATDVVRGDLMLLEAGDRVSADGIVVEAHGFALDAAVLTGESVPEHPGAGDTVAAGTFVVGGDAVVEVTATGTGTRLAAIARLTDVARRPPSPLAAELHRVVRVVAVMAVGVGVAFFAVAVALGMGTADGVVFAIGVTVALVPEGLLPTVTLSLARGAQQMAHRRALVRHLEAVETLGSTSVVCTDKTGTLTLNRMTVVEVWTPDAAVSAATVLAEAARTCTATWRLDPDSSPDGGTERATGDPMEVAILRAAAGAGVDTAGDLARRPALRRLPFDPDRRFAAAVLAEPADAGPAGAGATVVVKGAPDALVPRAVPTAGGGNAAVDAAAHALADRGLRLLAVARRHVAADELPGVLAAHDPVVGLEIIGIVAFEDPPRPDARETLAACRGAGIRVAMVTGDHPATAVAIARETGLAIEPVRVVDGTALPDDDDALGALVDHDGVVVARVTPEGKLRIARALRARGHVVAMTGDGVNDAAALREADIGVAMGTGGTDVAREAADLVLLDDDLATIVAAVEQGRATFFNVRRFLTYHLTDNVAELTPFVVWALSGGSVPLALGVLQVLCLDIGTDLLPALALGAEAPSHRALAGPPIRSHLIDRSLMVRVFGVLGPTEAALEMAVFVMALTIGGWTLTGGDPDPAVLAAASGAAFATVVAAQMANAFACRSVSRPPWRLRRRNPLLVGAVVAEAVVLVAFLGIPPVADTIGHTWPPFAAAFAALGAVPVLLSVDAAHKAWRVRRLRRERPAPGRTARGSALGSLPSTTAA